MATIEIGVSKTLLSFLTPEEIAKINQELTYENKSFKFQANKWKKQWYFRTQILKMSPEKFESIHQELKAKIPVCLSEEVSNSSLLVPSGLVNRVKSFLVNPTIIDKRKPPKSRFPFNVNRKNIPSLRPYQLLQKDAALDKGQGTIVSATATGKTVVIQEIIRELGLNAIVVVPSVNIAAQTIRRFERYFDPKLIGQYGGGKKQIKPITISVAASLAKGDPKQFGGFDVLILDEAHHCGSDTLLEICERVIPQAYYRLGFTATPERGDGADLAVEGAAFPPICVYSIQEGIKEGYLAKPRFIMVDVTTTDVPYTGDDQNKAYKAWILNNTKLTKSIKNAILEFDKKGKRVVVLIDEMSHGRMIAKDMPIEFVHGDGSSCLPEKEGKKIVCEHKQLVGDIVDKFNLGAIKHLVGTSCIGEGTDTIPIDVLFKLDGGGSKGAVLQNIGRGLRKTPTKDKVTIIDFYIHDESMLERHSQFREELYREIGEVIHIPQTTLDS